MNFYYSSMPADTESVLRTDSLWWTSLDTNRKQVARTFGRNLRDLMALHGITIRQMADWLSVSPSLVEAWRQGQSKPNYDDARASQRLFRRFPGRAGPSARLPDVYGSGDPVLEEDCLKRFPSGSSVKQKSAGFCLPNRRTRRRRILSCRIM